MLPEGELIQDQSGCGGYGCDPDEKDHQDPVLKRRRDFLVEMNH